MLWGEKGGQAAGKDGMEGTEGAAGRGTATSWVLPRLPARIQPGLQKAPGIVPPVQSRWVQKARKLRVPQAASFLALPGDQHLDPDIHTPLLQASTTSAFRPPSLSPPPVCEQLPALGPKTWRCRRSPPPAAPCGGSLRLSPRYPVAKLPAPSLSRHRYGRATAEGLLL